MEHKSSHSHATASAQGLLAGEGRRRRIERVFRNLDEDGDGMISARELRSGMRAMGEELTEEEAEEIVESLDWDGDGLVGCEDFVRAVEEGGGEEEEEKDLKEAFAMYEMDGCGCITPRSLKQMLGRLGESKTIDECQAMICRFDLNGDGVLSFEEFRRMMAV
ncbi:putative calcium-binding protein cml31 [Asimina triloba]